MEKGLIKETDDTEEYKLLEIWYKLGHTPEKLTETEKKIVREYGVEI